MTGAHAAPPHPTDLIREALLEPVPCPRCGRTAPCRCIPDHAAETDTMAARITERLATAGLLHLEPAGPPAEITQADAEQTARWLAEQSRHPRYTATADAWRQLLDSEANVTHAHAAALRAAQPATGQLLADLAAARSVLTRWQTARRADAT